MRPLIAGLTAVLLTLLPCRALRAELPQTPYSAVVVQDEVLVRSGPGKDSYYPTGKLKRGDRVTVRRHDPGGWFMIDPPPGSFSWIDAQFVRRQRGNEGVVTENNFARIGTEFGQPPNWIRHLIPAGTRVQILGEATLQTERGPVRVFKIKPPPGEYRWIPGAAVVPVDQTGRVAGNTAPVDGLPETLTALPSDSQGQASRGPVQSRPASQPTAAVRSSQQAGSAPGTGSSSGAAASGRAASSPERPTWPGSSAPSGTAAPSGSGRSLAGRQPAAAGRRQGSPTANQTKQHSGGKSRQLLERPLVRITDQGTRTEPTARERQLQQQKQRLDELDEQFRQMVRRKISEWDFTQLEFGYKSLAAEVDDPSLAYQLKLRLDAVERYKRKKQEYDEFVRLTEETSRRDAQLLALERRLRSHGTRVGPAQWNPPSELDGRQREVDAEPTPPSSSRPTEPAPTSRWPHAAEAPSRLGGERARPAEPRSRRSASPRSAGPLHLDGAGIVQRVANAPLGAPPYALVAPDGRLLTYLQPGPNVDLERYVGQAVGIIGPRYYRSDLRADYAIVRRLVPVRLKP